MNKNIVYLLIAIGITFYLLSPGVWWGDTLNSYIHGISGNYGSAQPVLIDLLFNITRAIYPGSLLLFSVCIIGYFTGFYLLVFGLIKHRIVAPVVFFLCSFYPSLFANIGVLQTEALQLAVLALFIPLTIFLYRRSGSLRVVQFVLLALLLGIFALVRYDTLHIVLLLCYWLCFSLHRQHSIKTVATMAALLVMFYITGIGLKAIVGLPDDSDTTMRNTLLVADIAAISAASDHDYVPAYCWQGYLPAQEKSVARIQYGMREWKSSFFSYIYNIDPKVGLFTYDIQGHEDDLRSRWRATVFTHPFYYIQYHLRMFGYLLDNDNFNLGLWGGLKDSHINHARLEIASTAQVDSFMQAHGHRYTYQDGYLLLAEDDKMISEKEEKEIGALVPPRRAGDVRWMVWYSHIPRSLYMVRNERAEKYAEPFMEWFMKHFRWLSCLFPFGIALAALLAFCARRIKDRYLQLTFIILCLCGIIHLAVRALIITDPVFRFGILAILFTFYAGVLAVAGTRQADKPKI